MKQVNIGVGHRLAVLVNNGSRQMVFSLMGTLNGNFPVCNAYADGIKAYHLTDGIGHGLAMNGGGDAEVFQFVVEEVDFVVGGLGIQLAQGIAERHIVVFTIYQFTIYDLLRLHPHADKTADEHNNDSFHSLLNNDFSRLVLTNAFIKPYVQAFETVQLLNGMSETVLAFPYEVEAQLAGIIV